MERLRSCDRQNRTAGRKSEDISPKVWKTTLKHLSKTQEWRWGRQRSLRGICQVNEPKKTTLRGMPIRNYKQQQQKNNKITTKT